MSTNEQDQTVPAEDQAMEETSENVQKEEEDSDDDVDEESLKMFNEFIKYYKETTGIDLNAIIEEHVATEMLMEEMETMETFDPKMTGLKINTTENVDNDPPCYGLSDIPKPTFEYVMKYLSTRDITNWDYCLCWQLLRIAKIFKFPEPMLKEIRGHLFHDVWFNSNHWVAYQEGLKLKEEGLVEAALMGIYCSGFPSENCSECYEFLNLEPEKLLALVQVESFRFKEDEMFNACIAWARSRASRTIPGTDTIEPFLMSPTVYRKLLKKNMIPKRRDVPLDHKLVRQYMEPLLPHFRFFSLPRTELKKLLQESKIFSPVAIEMLCNPKSNLPNAETFRSKFCQLKTPRNKKPVLDDMYIHGLDEKTKIDTESFITNSPHSSWNCDFPLEEVKERECSHVMVHFRTMLKSGEEAQHEGDMYQEKFKLVLYTDDNHTVFYTSDTYVMEAQFNTIVKVQFNVPDVSTESDTKLMMVHHCSGSYATKKLFIELIDGSEQGG